MKKKDKILITPYLNFNGNCLEAMEFYTKIFEAKLDVMTFEGSPVPAPDYYKEKILHATLDINGVIIMASDTLPDNPATKGDAFHISLSCSNVKMAEKFFKALQDGGEVIMPFETQFWGDMFGMVKDRFDVNWMIDHQSEK